MWDAVEADFMRDYGIDLIEQLDRLTWRRFTILFRNLSPYGATASAIEAYKKEHASDVENVDEGRAQATAFFSAVMSTSGVK